MTGSLPVASRGLHTKRSMGSAGRHISCQRSRMKGILGLSSFCPKIGGTGKNELVPNLREEKSSRYSASSAVVKASWLSEVGGAGTVLGAGACSGGRAGRTCAETQVEKQSRKAKITSGVNSRRRARTSSPLAGYILRDYKGFMYIRLKDCVPKENAGGQRAPPA